MELKIRFFRHFLPISRVLRMIHFISRKDKIFSQVCIHLTAKAGLGLVGPFTFVCTTVLEEGRGQKTGEKRENKAIVESLMNTPSMPVTSIYIVGSFFFLF